MNWDKEERIADRLHHAIDEILTNPEHLKLKPLIVQLAALYPCIPTRLYRKWFPDGAAMLKQLVRMGVVEAHWDFITLNKLLIPDDIIPNFEDIIWCERCGCMLISSSRKPRHQRPYICNKCKK